MGKKQTIQLRVNLKNFTEYIIYTTASLNKSFKPLNILPLKLNESTVQWGTIN